MDSKEVAILPMGKHGHFAFRFIKTSDFVVLKKITNFALSKIAY